MGPKHDNSSDDGTKARRPLTVDEQLALARDQAFHGPHRINTQNHLWVAEASGLAGLALTTKLPPFDVAVFWLRLFGVLHDLRLHWQRRLTQESEQGTTTPVKLQQLREVIGVADAVRVALTEKELIFLEYRRDYEAHPIQNKYHVTRTAEGVRTSCKFALLDGAQRELEAVQEITTQMVAREDDAGVARIMASKVADDLARLAKLTSTLR